MNDEKIFTSARDLTPHDFVIWLHDFLEVIGDDESLAPEAFKVLKQQHQSTLKAMHAKTPDGPDEAWE